MTGQYVQKMMLMQQDPTTGNWIPVQQAPATPAAPQQTADPIALAEQQKAAAAAQKEAEKAALQAQKDAEKRIILIKQPHTQSSLFCARIMISSVFKEP